MSKGNRLRAMRDRDELMDRRATATQRYWKKQIEALKAHFAKLNEAVPSENASLAAADEHTKLSQELDPRRPCGGVNYCVTRNNTRASHPHVGCMKAWERGEWT